MESEEVQNILRHQETLKTLFENPSNVCLFIELEKSVLSKARFAEKEIKSELDRNDVLSSVVLTMLNQFVFYPCFAIYLFQDNPFKLLKWLTAFLIDQEDPLQETVLKLILIIINDPARFQQGSGNLDYIKSQLETKTSIDLTKSISRIPVKWEIYFKNEFTEEKVNMAFSSVRGLQPEIKGSDLSSIINKPQKAQKKLNEIWIPAKKHYYAVIDFLKEESPSIRSAFIKDDGEKLMWRKFHGGTKYLSGFIKTCMDQDWIPTKNYAAPHIVRILENTFSIKPSCTSFKIGELQKLNSTYIDPFINLPARIAHLK